MARILFAWELGEGLGHVQRLLPIALRMRSLGHDCVFAVRNIYNAHGLLIRHGFPALPGPPVQVQRSEAPTTTLADILTLAGFARIDRLWPLLSAWEAIVAQVKPDLIVGDYSPGLCLAMRGGDVPVAIVGSGFTVPPESEEFPLLIDGAERAPSGPLLATLNEVQARRGRAPLTHLPQMFTAQARFITTLPELDRHDELRTEESRSGPLKPLPPRTNARPKVDYFAYVALDWPKTAIILEGLLKSRMKGSIYLREASPKQVAEYREKGLVIHDSPRDMEAELANAAVLVHHCGLGTLEIGLAMGRPQMLFPRHLEQRGNAAAAARLGVSLSTRARPDFSVDDVAGGLAKLRGDAKFAMRAQAQAQRIAQRGYADGIDRILPVLQRLLG
jgi:UDP:flavonoid glycosyltransferase YjiC (YdhE family)